MTSAQDSRSTSSPPRRALPRTGNPVQMAFDPKRPPVGGGVAELPTWKPERADERQAVDLRGHEGDRPADK